MPKCQKRGQLGHGIFPKIDEAFSPMTIEVAAPGMSAGVGAFRKAILAETPTISDGNIRSEYGSGIIDMTVEEETVTLDFSGARDL